MLLLKGKRRNAKQANSTNVHDLLQYNSVSVSKNKNNKSSKVKILKLHTVLSHLTRWFSYHNKLKDNFSCVCIYITDIFNIIDSDFRLILLDNIFQGFNRSSTKTFNRLAGNKMESL